MDRRRKLVGVALSGLLSVPLTVQAATPPPQPTSAQSAIDPDASAKMRQMSDYVAGLKSFSFRADTVDEVVTTEGQKVQFVSSKQVEVRRPDRLRSDRLGGPNGDTSFIYDGKQFHVYGKQSGTYASVPAPAQLDAAIDDARGRYGIDAPGADLLLQNSYRELMSGVTSGRDLGIETVDGVPCHHLAFRSQNVDWQIWIQDGAQPLPRRYVIVSKDEHTQPEYAVRISEWNPQASLPDSTFNFQPPAGAQKVEIQKPPAPTPSP